MKIHAQILENVKFGFGWVCAALILSALVLINTLALLVCIKTLMAIVHG